MNCNRNGNWAVLLGGRASTAILLGTVLIGTLTATPLSAAQRVEHPPIEGVLLPGPYDSDPNTAALWHLDERTGQSGYRDSGTSNVLLRLNVATSGLQSINSQYRFDNALVGFTPTAYLVNSTAPIAKSHTFEAWVKWSDDLNLPQNRSTPQYIVVRTASAWSETFSAEGSGGAPRLRLTLRKTLASGAIETKQVLAPIATPLERNTWYHVAYLIEEGHFNSPTGALDTRIKLYLDDEANRNTTPAPIVQQTFNNYQRYRSGAWSATAAIKLGSGGATSTAFKGAIDEVRLSKVARTAFTAFATRTPPLALGPVVASQASLPNSVRVWNTFVANRRTHTGDVFYVNHTSGTATRVQLRFNAGGLDDGLFGRYADGQSANFNLRVFDRDDLPIFSAVLSPAVRGWYESYIDLTAQHPTGRYRFSIVGWHDDFEIATQPTQDIGVAGVPYAGLKTADAEQTFYFYVPAEVDSWKLKHLQRSYADYPSAGQPRRTIALYDDTDGLILSKVMPQDTTATLLTQNPESKYATETIDTSQKGAGVWRIVTSGAADFLLTLDGVPGILFKTREAALANAGDCVYVNGRRLAHQWQRPLMQWLGERTPADMTFIDNGMVQVDFNSMTNGEILKLNQFASWSHIFSVGRPLLQNYQVTDASSPYMGLFTRPGAVLPLLNPDSQQTGDDIYTLGDVAGQARLNHLGFVNTIASMHGDPLGGMNAYFENPAVLTRAMAGQFQLLISSVPERQMYEWTLFWEPRWVGLTARKLLPYLPHSLAVAYQAGLIEQTGRMLYFDGYNGNQSLNLLVGVRAVADVTGDQMLNDWYYRVLIAFVENKYVYKTSGQTASGYYLENSGFDGGYGQYASSVMSILRGVAGEVDHDLLTTSARRMWELIRHLAFTRNDASHTQESARAWNARTGDAGNVFNWGGHPQEALMDLPAVATFHTPPDYTAVRDSIARAWDHIASGEYIAPFTGVGGDFYEWTTSQPAAPVPMAQDEPGPFVRTFGNNPQNNERDHFMAARIGKWYAIFYTGDFWGVGASGSGMTTLWHEDFGPLILGDTKYEPTATPANSRDGLVLTLADAWTDVQGRRIAQNGYDRFGSLSGDVSTGLLSTTISTNQGWTLTRQWQIDPVLNRFATYQPVVQGGTIGDHDMYLPLVSGPDSSLTVLDADGNAISLTAGALNGTMVSGFRWTNSGKTMTLRLPEPMPTYLLHDNEPIGTMTLDVFRVHVGGLSGAWEIVSSD